MAPTLNCTLGDPAANSYVCLDEAEQIAANIPGGDEWIALSEDEKVFSLIAATALLETLSYAGTVCTTTQRLKWPREGVDCEGRPFDCTAIPYKIKEATVMLAMQMAKDTWWASSVEVALTTALRVPSLSGKMLGDLEIEYAAFPSNYAWLTVMTAIPVVAVLNCLTECQR